MTSAHPPRPQVRLHVWRVASRRVIACPVAARRTVRRLRRDPAVTFATMLGTASPRFTPRAATPTRWALVCCGRGDHDAAATAWWDRHADESATLSLRTLSARGAWAGTAPFDPDDDTSWAGPVVALTRATLRVRAAHRFYRAVAPVAAELAAADGCRVAFGIGEAPVLRQGTVSVWESVAALRAFAYGAPAHLRAVTETPRQKWYAEELYARFALLDATGSIDGTALS